MFGNLPSAHQLSPGKIPLRGCEGKDPLILTLAVEYIQRFLMNSSFFVNNANHLLVDFVRTFLRYFVLVARFVGAVHNSSQLGGIDNHKISIVSHSCICSSNVFRVLRAAIRPSSTSRFFCSSRRFFDILSLSTKTEEECCDCKPGAVQEVQEVEGEKARLRKSAAIADLEAYRR